MTDISHYRYNPLASASDSDKSPFDGFTQRERGKGKNHTSNQNNTQNAFKIVKTIS